MLSLNFAPKLSFEPRLHSRWTPENLSLHCCLFVLMFYMVCICLLILKIIIHQQVLPFFISMLILTKMLIVFKVRNNASSKNIWLIFSALLLFLQVWFNISGNITLRLSLFLFVYLLLFFTQAH